MWYKDAVGASFENFTCKDPDVIVEGAGDPGFRTMPGSRDDVIEKVSDAVFESHPDRISVTDLKHYDGTFVPAKALPTYDADAIVVAKGLQDKFGTLCHYVLEVLMRDGSYDSVECNLTDSERDNQILLDQAKAFADGFVASDFYTRHVLGNKTEQELRFYTSKDDDDVAIEGVVDLLVFGDDYNLVVDYKTDSFRKPQEHKIQVQTYVKVAEQLYGKKCYGTLFYLRDGNISDVWDRNGEVVDLI